MTKNGKFSNFNMDQFHAQLSMKKSFITSWPVSISAEKYCDLLEEEGGLQLLEDLSVDPRPINEIRLLAQQILNFIKHRKATGCDNNNQMNGGVNEHGENDDALDG